MDETEAKHRSNRIYQFLFQFIERHTDTDRVDVESYAVYNNSQALCDTQ